MPRPPRTTSLTDFGQHLLNARLKTRSKAGYYRGQWPLSQAAFCALLNKAIGDEPLNLGSYIGWENGRNTPKQPTQEKVLAALKRLPPVGRTGDK